MTKRVLITGMTAHHYSPVVIDRTASFAQAATTLLRDSGVAVSIAQPTVHWNDFYLEDYDHILLGIAPPMALSANSIYGALHVIGTMYDSDKLTFFIDSPEHWQIFANIKAIIKNPDSLFKEFYSRRSGYYSAAQNGIVRDHILKAVQYLHERPWHRTLFPVLPWSDEQHLTSNTPENARISMVGISIDSAFYSEETSFNSNRENKWFVENEKSKWTTLVTDSLSFPTVSTKSAKLRSDEEIIKELSTSAGALLGPGGDKKFWWSPRYAQAMNSGTPVATEWKDSSSIGSSWNHLAVAIEEMSWIDRFELSVSQKRDYFDRIESKKDTAAYLRTLIGIK